MLMQRHWVRPTCDSSANALGACFPQRKNGVERPVSFASRMLSPAEKKFSTSEREALSCIWACVRWHFYLHGRRFVLISDHQALKTLLTAGGSEHRRLRLHCWCDRLFSYNFQFQFRSGRLNVALTRCQGHSMTLTPLRRQRTGGYGVQRVRR